MLNFQDRLPKKLDLLFGQRDEDEIVTKQKWDVLAEKLALRLRCFKMNFLLD